MKSRHVCDSAYTCTIIFRPRRILFRYIYHRLGFARNAYAPKRPFWVHCMSHEAKPMHIPKDARNDANKLIFFVSQHKVMERWWQKARKVVEHAVLAILCKVLRGQIGGRTRWRRHAQAYQEWLNIYRCIGTLLCIQHGQIKYFNDWLLIVKVGGVLSSEIPVKGCLWILEYAHKSKPPTETITYLPGSQYGAWKAMVESNCSRDDIVSDALLVVGDGNHCFDINTLLALMHVHACAYFMFIATYM